MKNRSIGKTLLSIFLGIIAALIVAAIAGYIIFKTVLLPKYTAQLAAQGQGEIAKIVEENANLGAFASLGSLLADSDVMNFIQNIDRESAKSVIEVLETLGDELPVSQPQNKSDEWQVHRLVPIPSPTNTPNPSPTPSPEPEAPQSSQSAYNRIASVATADEIAEGLRIIAKLDIGYVTSRTAGGLTSAEKSEIMQYVKTVLTPAEISRAWELYCKYKIYL